MIHEKAENLTECFRILRDQIPNTVEQYEKYHISRTSCYPVEQLLTKINAVNMPLTSFIFGSRKSRIKVVYAGQRGVGKTTELHFIEEILKKKLHVIFINSKNDKLNFSDFQSADILAAFLKKIMEHIPKESKIDKETILDLESLQLQLIGEVEYEKIKSKNKEWHIGGLLDFIGAKLSSDIQTREIFRKTVRTLSKEFIDSFNKLVEIVETELGKNIIIILDDLEKVTDLKRIEKFLISEKDIVHRLNCNIIFAIPPTLRLSTSYTLIKDTLPDELFLPLFEIFTYDKQTRKTKINKKELNEMCEIVYRRIEPNLIDDNAIKLSAIYSGGIVANMLSMCADACIDALTAKKSFVDIKFIDSAFNTFRAQYEGALFGKDQKEKLYQVHLHKKLNMEMDNAHDLFICSILLYKNNDHNISWYDTNPALWNESEINEIKESLNSGKY